MIWKILAYWVVAAYAALAIYVACRWIGQKKGGVMNKFWWWIFEHISLGRLAPYVLGLALGSRPRRVK